MNYSLIAGAFLCLLLTGCASERYLTAQEDADLRKACEERGCVIIPSDLWGQVKRLLGMQDI